MSKKVKNTLILWSLIVSIFAGGAVFPAIAAAKGSIVGEVSSIDETTGSLFILDDLVEVDISSAEIEKKGVDNATISDIEEGDIVRIKGSSGSDGVITATSVKGPVKLKKGYDGRFIGNTSKVDTSAETFNIMGQEVDASSLSSIGMDSRTISFSNMRSGVSVDVYVKAQNSGLVARKMTIRSASCNYCH